MVSGLRLGRSPLLCFLRDLPEPLDQEIIFGAEAFATKLDIVYVVAGRLFGLADPDPQGLLRQPQVRSHGFYFLVQLHGRE